MLDFIKMCCNIIYMKRIILSITFLLCLSLCFAESFEVLHKSAYIENTMSGSESIQHFIEKGFYIRCKKQNGDIYLVPKDKIELFEILGDTLIVHTVNNTVYKYSLKNYNILLDNYWNLCIDEKK